MLLDRISSTQQPATTPTPGAHQVGPTRAEIRDQIRQSIEDAKQAAMDAKQAARDAKIAQSENVTIGRHGVIVGTHASAMPGMPVIVQGGGSGPFDNVIPPQAVDIALGFFIMCAVMVIGWPLARAFGRRIERRGDVAMIDPALAGQLQRIEQAVEAMSIEIERISESQRFMAKLQNGAAAERSVPSIDRR
jgi:hypothetical protein